MNLIQQSNIVFATFFLYDRNGTPHWYVASDVRGTNAPTDQPYIFSGPLYETTGPAFSAAAFAASAVTRRQVGSLTFMFSPPNSGHVMFTADGVTFDREVQRQTWAAMNLNGRYFGGTFTARSPFAPAASCNPRTGTQMFDDIVVTQSGNSVSITAASGAVPPELCRYTGTLTQFGHMGRIEGTYSCNSGTSGGFTLGEVEVGATGLSARYSATPSDCQALEALFGNFTAVRTQ